jgi:hypothetical protein
MSDRDTLVSSLAVAECKMRLPRTQEDCCGIIARITLTVRGEPKSEAELMGLALGNAQGLLVRLGTRRASTSGLSGLICANARCAPR